jgi:hypothetical protein
VYFLPRCLNLQQFEYAGSVNEAVVVKVAALYKRVKAAKGIIGPVPAQLSEDETKIDSSIVFDLRSNTLVGFCGDITEQHMCNIGGEHVQLPPGPDGR